MARASRELAEQHKVAIEQASARLFREHGLHGVTVAQVMADAGLTHGGFYGHFASKDNLVAVACQRAFEDGAQRWEHRIASANGDRRTARNNLVGSYLSPEHRDCAGEGCAASALVGDVAREPASKPVRPVYVDGVKQLIDIWMSTAPDGATDAAARQTALVQLAAMVGAMSLARATGGDALSQEFLDATRAWLLDDSERAHEGSHETVAATA
ncbi:TetR/AcrR family transcriptional regulator [Cupriavidus sp. RAF12]|uniref:TetR/AcrR family transcriptional regulator n=1 Tax=Cupriavidus sp. RAF12 TaxID=3233050 RepID=UPI003F91A508